VRHWILPIGHAVPELATQLWIEDRDRAIGGDAVTFRIGGVVFQRSQCERIFVQVLGLTDELRNEIATPDIMREVAEKAAAERIISQVLNDAASVSIGVGQFQLRRRSGRKSFEEQFLKGSIPDGIDDGLMGENCVAVRDRG